VLVALYWCANKLFKQLVHHINNNPVDNRASNLLWVTYEQHEALHKLLDLEKEKEYFKLVESIKKENGCYEKKTTYFLIDEELSDNENLSVYTTKYEGYRLLVSGRTIDDLICNKLILKQFVVANEGKKEQSKKVEEV
jgi:hypothetical protein